MLGFDVIEGKYKFEADWCYFEIEQDPSDIVEEAYVRNEEDYRIRKEFFQRNQKIYPYTSFGGEFTSVEALEQEFAEKQTSGWGLDYPEVNGILDDIRFMTERGKNCWKIAITKTRFSIIQIYCLCRKMQMVIHLHISDLLQATTFKLMVRIVYTCFSIKN